MASPMPCCCGLGGCVCVIPSSCSPARALWEHHLSLADWMAALKLICLRRGGQREGKARKIIKLSFRVQISRDSADLPAPCVVFRAVKKP